MYPGLVNIKVLLVITVDSGAKITLMYQLYRRYPSNMKSLIVRMLLKITYNVNFNCIFFVTTYQGELHASEAS